MLSFPPALPVARRGEDLTATLAARAANSKRPG